MQAPVRHIVWGEEVWLSADRSVFWEKQRALIVADLHFGKTGHFRKSGIGVPQTVFKEDIQRLVSLIQFFKPQQLIVVGDMFHSDANKELDFFGKWRKDFNSLHIHLVKGNHDILKGSWYLQHNIQLHHEYLQTDCFLFQHEFNDTAVGGAQDKYVFCGHIHPGVSMRGLARQSLQFPCFYFGETYCALPAFSKFTGFCMVKKNRQNNVFAIVNNKIVTV